MKTTFVDKRGQVSTYITSSVQRYMNRAKGNISDAIKRYVDTAYLTFTPDQLHQLKVERIKLPRVHFLYESPEIASVHTRNGQLQDPHNPRSGGKFYNPGDIIRLNPLLVGYSGPGGTGEDSSVEMEFTEDVFLKKFLATLKLHNVYKKKSNKSDEFVRQRAGFIKEGVPANRSMKQTMKQYIARTGEGAGEEPLIDQDLRYYHHVMIPKPSTSCVALFLMDVSGSVTYAERMMARDFFWLMYQLLKYNYKYVTIRFFIHTTTIKEIEEEQFFECRLSGGTMFAESYKTLTNTITSEYNLDEENIYLIQTGDGDAFDVEEVMVKNGILDKLVSLLNFFYYVELNREEDGNSHFFNQLTEHRWYGAASKILCAPLTSEMGPIKTFKKLFKGKKNRMSNISVNEE